MQPQLANKYSSIFQNKQVQALLILDQKGFIIQNKQFCKSSAAYHIHSLHQLSNYFFKHNAKQTLIAIQNKDNTTLIKHINDSSEKIIAIRKTNPTQSESSDN